jgi:glycosyltransferase involved in cell wall biosynthesis
MEYAPLQDAHITVITATYNSARFLERCLVSLHAAYEMVPRKYRIAHLVVDGYSTDATRDIVQRLSPTSTVVLREKGGIYDALNYGVSLVQSPYVMYLHSDDELDVGFLAEMLKVIEKYNWRVDILPYGRVDFIEERSMKLFSRKPPIYVEPFQEYINLITHPNGIYPAFIEKTNPYNTTLGLGADRYHIREIARVLNLIRVPQATYRFRMSSTSRSVMNPLHKNWNIRRILINKILRRGYLQLVFEDHLMKRTFVRILERRLNWSPKQEHQDTQKSIRILHVVGGLNVGGIETWVMHVLRNIDRTKYQIDFLLANRKGPGDFYEEEVLSLGCRIFYCPTNKKQPWNFASNFKHILREHGPYDIVHSHTYHFSGYILWLAHQENVPIRIAHSHTHNASTLSNTKFNLLRKAYLYTSKYLIQTYTTSGLAASYQAATSLYGSKWKKDTDKWQVLYCGIKLDPFREKILPEVVRNELGIPPNAFVIGHAGRFDQPKNHTFLVDIALEVARQNNHMYLLLVGDGPLRTEIEHKVARLGLINRVIFTGVRSDVPRLMMGAMDVFVMPSLYEGLGLGLIEAQAAGLPCIFSDIVPHEADVVKPLVHRLSLNHSPEVWANTILEIKQNPSPITQPEALSIVESSDFNIVRSVENLTNLYRNHSNHT